MRDFLLDQLTFLKDLAIDGIILLTAVGVTSLSQLHVGSGGITCGNAPQATSAEVSNQQP